jgi:amidase
MNEPDVDVYNAKWTDAAFMFAFNISGLPAMSVPATWTDQNVPIGVQLVGRYGDEGTILRVAAQLEEAQPWRDRRPAITAPA